MRAHVVDNALRNAKAVFATRHRPSGSPLSGGPDWMCAHGSWVMRHDSCGAHPQRMPIFRLTSAGARWRGRAPTEPRLRHVPLAAWRLPVAAQYRLIRRLKRLQRSAFSHSERTTDAKPSTVRRVGPM
eukprot:5195590-Prymnesium_polylepis.1